jgi:hypothetical protein
MAFRWPSAQIYPRVDGQGAGIGSGDGRDLLDGGGACQVVHGDLVEDSPLAFPARTESNSSTMNSMVFFILRSKSLYYSL